MAKKKPVAKKKAKPAARKKPEPARRAGLAGETSIEDFAQALAMKSMLMGNLADATVSSDEWRALLRAFLWFSHDPPFEDLREACLAAMPVLGGCLVQHGSSGGEKYELDALQETMGVLQRYLDCAALALPERREATSVVQTGLYRAAEIVAAAKKSVLDVAPFIREKHEALAKRGSPSLRKLLAKSDAERLETLASRFRDLTTAKNFVYNIVRAKGDRLLDEIEATIHALHPADQDFILHGLDAFPKNKKVLAFFERFLAKNRYASLAEAVAKYAGRVKKGVKTTGWET